MERPRSRDCAECSSQSAGSDEQNSAAVSDGLLIVDMDGAFAGELARRYRGLGYQADAVVDGESALSVASRRDYALISAAWSLPGTTALEVVRALRVAGSRAPAVLLAESPSADFTFLASNEGLNVAAYLSKAMPLDSIVARTLDVLVHREPIEVITVGSISLYMPERRASYSGRSVRLTPLEFRLLTYLALYSEEFVTRRRLLDHVWKRAREPESSLIETNMCRLRRKLNREFQRDCIQSVRHRGYRLRVTL